MASSGNNITAVHFSLIFFVMLSIILGVVAYLNVDKLNELRAKAKKAEEDKNSVTTVRDRYAEAHRNLQGVAGAKGDLGKDAANSGRAEAPAAQLKNVLKSAGDENSNLVDLLQKKLQQIESEKKSLAAEKKKLEDATQKYIADVAAANKNYNDAKTKMEAAQRAEQTAKDDQRKAEANLAAARLKHSQELAAVRAQMAQQKIAYDRQIEALNKNIVELSETIARKQKIINGWVNTNFERPDGLIRWVDHTTRLVWVNIGSADKLPRRPITFSVYSQKSTGVARDSDRFKKLGNLLHKDLISKIPDTRQRTQKVDKIVERAKMTTHDRGTGNVKSGGIKGSIEITRIISEHLSQARILSNDPYDPIRAGDPIYTPLWTPGIEERFAFAVELDGRQYSGLNWPLLKRIVANAGAKIDAELNPIDGKIINTSGGLTDKTKFLVVTDLLPADQAGNPREKARRIQMSKSQKALKDEAEKSGVRIVNLSDFLQYIGYKADRRLWRPGDSSSRKLKAGARSTTTDETIGRRHSSGQVSGAFSKRGRGRAQQKSSGQASGVFGKPGGGY